MSHNHVKIKDSIPRKVCPVEIFHFNSAFDTLKLKTVSIILLSFFFLFVFTRWFVCIPCWITKGNLITKFLALWLLNCQVTERNLRNTSTLPRERTHREDVRKGRRRVNLALSKDSLSSFEKINYNIKKEKKKKKKKTKLKKKKKRQNGAGRRGGR